MSTQNQAMTVGTQHAVSISKALQLVGALLLGVVILYGVGFMQTSAVHNAAHDVRHAAAFPCH